MTLNNINGSNVNSFVVSRRCTLNTQRNLMNRGIILTALASILLLPIASSGQEDGGSGFLFYKPKASFGVRFGYAQPSASSDIFNYVRQQFTINTRDFAAATVAVDIAIRATERLDIVANIGTSESSTTSEYRDWVDGFQGYNKPIEQTTTFLRVPITLNLKLYLRDRGRSVSQFVWVPNRWSPYIGVGGGATWSKFRQEGRFVDYQTEDIFSGDLVSQGSGLTANFFSGIDFSIHPKWILNFEGRYSWAKTDMSGSYPNYTLDLSGLQGTAGFSILF